MSEGNASFRILKHVFARSGGWERPREDVFQVDLAINHGVAIFGNWFGVGIIMLLIRKSYVERKIVV